MPDLAADESQLLAMKCAAERNRDGTRAEPAQFEHRGFIASQSDCRFQAGGRAACVDDDIAAHWRQGRSRKRDPKRARHLLACRIDIDQRDLGARHLPAQVGDQHPDDTAADDGNPVSRARHGVPDRIERRFHICGEHGPRWRHIVGQGEYGVLRVIEKILMRMQGEHAAPGELVRPGFNHADGRVAVLHGKRERASHERRAHAPVFRSRHPAGEYQRFGAPAECAKRCPYANFPKARQGQRLAAKLGLAGRGIPERLCGVTI